MDAINKWVCLELTQEFYRCQIICTVKGRMRLISRLDRLNKWALVTMVAVVMLAGLSVSSKADLRIVSAEDGQRTEILLKGSRVLSPVTDDGWMMIDCTTEQVTIVAERQYWQGSVTELSRALDESIQGLLEPAEAAPAVPSFLSGLFGSSAKPAEIEVKVTQIGNATVAGYQATHHRVETRQGSDWKTYEDVWVSSALLQDVKTEVGECMSIATDLGQQMASLAPFGMDEVMAVLESPAYRALFETGYPVRSVSKFQVFGISVDVETEVVEVNRNQIPDGLFTLPTNYRRVESPAKLFGM